MATIQAGQTATELPLHKHQIVAALVQARVLAVWEVDDRPHPPHLLPLSHGFQGSLAQQAPLLAELCSMGPLQAW